MDEASHVLLQEWAEDIFTGLFVVVSISTEVEHADTLERLRSPLCEAFSYGIRHILLWFSEVWPYASLNRNEICRNLYQSALPTELRNFCIDTLSPSLELPMQKILKDLQWLVILKLSAIFQSLLCSFFSHTCNIFGGRNILFPKCTCNTFWEKYEFLLALPHPCTQPKENFQ